MSSQLWTSDVTLLYREGRLKELFPTRGMSFAERVNAIVRLVVMATVCVYMYNRDTRYVLYGLFAIALVTAVAAFRSPPVHPGGSARPQATHDGCTHPTPENPFANPLLTDYRDNPNKPPACNVDDVRGEIEQAYAATQVRNAGQRDFSINSFYSVPDSSTWHAGREAFAKALYGPGPTCKQDQAFCGR